MVRPHMEYAHCILSVYREKLIKELETIQMRATKLKVPYKQLGLTIDHRVCR